MKKNAVAAAIGVMLFLCAVGCSGRFSPDESVTVITREAGSGTRTAFTEMFGISYRDENGIVRDRTSVYADVNDSTGIVIANVSSNRHAVGYISAAAMSDEVKPLAIDGVLPTVETIEDGSYPASRPFILAYKGSLTPPADDFMTFVMSEQGREITRENGFIPTGGITEYSAGQLKGKITIAGSSSVSPLAEKLAEAYEEICAGVTVEIQQSDSSSGMKAVAQGICDIGMSSRELKESELTGDIRAKTLALDGIAVIVHPDNILSQVSLDDVRRIYTGEATIWREVIP